MLLDVIMPGFDGFATFAEIRREAKWADIPVLFMTAVDEPAQKVRALEAGAVDYISKPVHPPEVLARVRTHLDLRAARRELQRQNAKLEAEIAVRLDAEACLAQSLDRAMLTTDGDGRIVFQTLRATHLLHKHLPTHQPGRFPEIVGATRSILAPPQTARRFLLSRRRVSRRGGARSGAGRRRSSLRRRRGR